MTRAFSPRLFAIAAAGTLALASCGGEAADDSVQLDFLVGSGPEETALAEALADEFTAQNPDISVSVNTRPHGGEGDNLVKTRLSTGEMDDVFMYNTGSLFQAISPDQTLVPVDDQPWVDDLDENYLVTVSTEEGVYGQSWGATFAGGMLYSKPIYEELGLSVPETWDEFMENNKVIDEAGIVPVVQTYGDTNTEQIIVLADFANVLSVDPEWADEHTAGNRNYAEGPALRGFEKHQDVAEAGYLNEDFPSALHTDGARMIATGEAAHYPGLSNLVTTIEQNNPEDVGNVGYFPIPADEAQDTQATQWQSSGLYLPKTTEGETRKAALAFLDFVGSEEGCDLQNQYFSPGGPFPGTCELPDDVAPVVSDVEAYVESGEAAPALEFLSPVKGPNLEHILVELGSGQTDAETAAARYDEDVVNQARQLGLEGW